MEIDRRSLGGGGQVLEDVLFGYPITGHFRYGLE
jgi:hypothetical protein